MADRSIDQGQKSNSEVDDLGAGLSQQSSQSQPLLPIVGVGASAGGLDAFKQLLRCLSRERLFLGEMKDPKCGKMALCLNLSK